jgi:hypothetical protein
MTGTQNIPAQIVSQEPSTVLPFVVRRDASKNGLHESPYPFVAPSTDYERGWWDEMRRQAMNGTPQRKADFSARLRRWAPLLRLMTPSERQVFHDQRLASTANFAWDIDSARGDSEREGAERRLHDAWKLNLKGRTA